MDMIIPFKGKNSSFAFKTNLLLKEGNIYLMDNHRMAAWCWAQEIDLTKKYTIVHIDKHYDTSTHDQLDIYSQNIKKPLKSLSALEYDVLDYEYDKNEWAPIFSWDNYIPIFHHYYSKNVKNYLFFTHGDGEFWENLNELTEHFSSTNLIDDFLGYFKQSKANIIVNLDIDYFFDDNYKIAFTDKQIVRIFENIYDIIVIPGNLLTISLSPECCGCWENSIDFIKMFGAKIGLSNIPI